MRRATHDNVPRPLSSFTRQTLVMGANAIHTSYPSVTRARDRDSSGGQTTLSRIDDDVTSSSGHARSLSAPTTVKTDSHAVPTRTESRTEHGLQSNVSSTALRVEIIPGNRDKSSLFSPHIQISFRSFLIFIIFHFHNTKRRLAFSIVHFEFKPL